MPPYVKESVPDTIERIKQLASGGPWTAESLLKALDEHAAVAGALGCRAGLEMALMDWKGQLSHLPVYELIDTAGISSAESVMTIGICSVEQALEQLRTLPETGALKLKVGDAGGFERVQAILAATSARILLDGNQGIGSVEGAAELTAAVGPDRLIGIEQPFPTNNDAESAALGQTSGAVVFADESLQDESDLERIEKIFSGVNIKLMKCGGLDRALSIAKHAKEEGLKVMLGSMSESSLGCTAMAHLGSLADVLDLDGPWLIANDPFVGVTLMGGRLRLPDGPGFGVRLKADLEFIGV